jgi:hypothetical protein
MLIRLYSSELCFHASARRPVTRSSDTCRDHRLFAWARLSEIVDGGLATHAKPGDALKEHVTIAEEIQRSQALMQHVCHSSLTQPIPAPGHAAFRASSSGSQRRGVPVVIDLMTSDDDDVPMASGDSQAELSARDAPVESQAMAVLASAQAAISHTSDERGPGEPLLAASLSSQRSEAGDWVVRCSVEIERRTLSAMQPEKARWRQPLESHLECHLKDTLHHLNVSCPAERLSREPAPH